MPTASPLEIPHELAGWEEYTEDNQFMQHIGPLWQRFVDGKPEYAFRVSKTQSSLLGVLHGGMICAYADHALGHVVFHLNGKKPVVTIHLDVNFISPARPGDVVRCRSEVVRKTRSLCFMRGTIMAKERCVATANGVFKTMDR